MNRVRLPNRRKHFRNGGGVTPTTWNPADIAASLSLSNGNLTITNGSPDAWRGVRSIASSSDAKWYYEMTVTNNTNKNILHGFATVASDLTTGVSAGTVTYFGQGSLFIAASQVVSGLPQSTGFDTLRFAIDIQAQKIWVGDEGGWWNSGDPAAGTNPLYASVPIDTYFAYASLNTDGDFGTADFGQSPAYEVPSGFTSVG